MHNGDVDRRRSSIIRELSELRETRNVNKPKKIQILVIGGV